MDLDQRMARLAAATHLAKRLRALIDEDRAVILAEIPAGERRKAVIDGCEVGTITTTQPNTTTRLAVTNPAAYAEWLMETDHLDMVRLMPTDWAMGDAAIRALWDDNLEPPPGISIIKRPGKPTVQVRVSDAQATTIDDLMSSQGMRLIDGSDA